MKHSAVKSVQQYEYQTTGRYFAQAAETVKELAMQEFETLGARNLFSQFGGFYFEADQATLYRIVYSARLASRILAPLTGFRCRTADDIHQHGMLMRWDDFLGMEETFAVFANVVASSVNHSKYAALRLKDAIADWFRRHHGTRPNVDVENPAIWFNLYLEQDQAVINLDVGGGSLHRRGYRQESLEAPMRETLAAAIIRLSAWDGTKPVYDPFCGAGTLLCEALMHYCRIPSLFLRQQFGFERLPDFNATLWRQIKLECDQGIVLLPEGLIKGSDLSGAAVAAARKNVVLLPHGDIIRLSVKDFRTINAIQNSVIICNPPYGIRLQPSPDIGDFYRAVGDFLKQRCQGSTAYIYFGERELIKKIGLKPTWKKPLSSGGLDGRLVKYELY